MFLTLMRDWCLRFDAVVRYFLIIHYLRFKYFFVNELKESSLFWNQDPNVTVPLSPHPTLLQNSPAQHSVQLLLPLPLLHRCKKTEGHKNKKSEVLIENLKMFKVLSCFLKEKKIYIIMITERKHVYTTSTLSLNTN